LRRRSRMPLTRFRRRTSSHISRTRRWSRCDAVVKLDAKSCEIWAGDQFQTVDQANAARIAGLDPQQVNIHTLYAGGSFGGARIFIPTTSSRRYRSPRPTAPTALRSSCSGPAKTTSQGGLYRPMYFHKMEAALSADKKLTGWRHVIVGQSIKAGTPLGGARKHR
jgi:isoquinoline 1-oxidoreductase beta subunit